MNGHDLRMLGVIGISGLAGIGLHSNSHDDFGEAHRHRVHQEVYIPEIEVEWVQKEGDWIQTDLEWRKVEPVQELPEATIRWRTYEAPIGLSGSKGKGRGMGFWTQPKRSEGLLIHPLEFEAARSMWAPSRPHSIDPDFLFSVALHQHREK